MSTADRINVEEIIPLADGTYDAVVTSVAYDAEGRFGAQWAWQFDPGDGRELRGWTPAKSVYTSQTKHVVWARAVLGQQAISFVPEEIEGKPCRLQVVQKVTQSGQTVNRVVGVYPAQPVPTQQPAPVPADPQAVTVAEAQPTPPPAPGPAPVAPVHTDADAPPGYDRDGQPIPAPADGEDPFHDQ